MYEIGYGLIAHAKFCKQKHPSRSTGVLSDEIKPDHSTVVYAV